MHLSKIVLENFQAFEKGEFVLSPNLNILVGVSNVGKSSVARALSLVLFNQWDKSWVKFGTKYCRVSILTDAGVEVIREKGEKVNRYILKLPSQQEQLFESFGTSVPEAVQQALHIHAVQVDTTDTLNLNLAGQMDSLFLLSQTGSYRAKVLGKLSGATYLDHAIRELNKDKRQVSADKNLKDLEIVEKQDQVDKLAPIEAYGSVITELESKMISLAAAEQRVERIRNLFGRVKVLKGTWIKESQKTELLDQLDLTGIEQLARRVDKIKATSLLSSKITHNNLSYTTQVKLQDLLKPVDLSVIPILVDRVVSTKKINDLVARVSKNNSEIVRMTNELTKVEQQHIEAAQQYIDKLKDAGVCPTCNQLTNNLCER